MTTDGHISIDGSMDSANAAIEFLLSEINEKVCDAIGGSAEDGIGAWNVTPQILQVCLDVLGQCDEEGQRNLETILQFWQRHPKFSAR